MKLLWVFTKGKGVMGISVVAWKFNTTVIFFLYRNTDKTTLIAHNKPHTSVHEWCGFNFMFYELKYRKHLWIPKDTSKHVLKIAYLIDWILFVSYELSVSMTIFYASLLSWGVLMLRHMGAYGDVLPKWVTFSPKILRQGCNFGQKSLEEGPSSQNCEKIEKSAVFLR